MRNIYSNLIFSCQSYKMWASNANLTNVCSLECRWNGSVAFGQLYRAFTLNKYWRLIRIYLTVIIMVGPRVFSWLAMVGNSSQRWTLCGPTIKLTSLLNTSITLAFHSLLHGTDPLWTRTYNHIYQLYCTSVTILVSPCERQKQINKLHSYINWSCTHNKQ